MAMLRFGFCGTSDFLLLSGSVRRLDFINSCAKGYIFDFLFKSPVKSGHFNCSIYCLYIYSGDMNPNESRAHFFRWVA